jgi:hypothetical protein
MPFGVSGCTGDRDPKVRIPPLKIQKIATVAVVPTAIAGLALSAGAAYAALSHAAPKHAAPKGGAATKRTTTDAASEWVIVQRGQTLASIAAAHHMSWEAIVATPPNNRHVHYPYRLSAGEHLRIPADPALRAGQFQAWQAIIARRKAAAAQQAREQAAAAAGQRAEQGKPVEDSEQAAPSLSSMLASASPFEQCVAWRESGDTPNDPDGLFGILPYIWQSLGYSGTAGQAPIALQQQAFTRLYAEYGAQPWQPSDGC